MNVRKIIDGVASLGWWLLGMQLYNKVALKDL